MMRGAISFFIFLLLGACVDRLQFDVDKPTTYPPFLEGYISNQPGPYTIRVSRTFDVESLESTRIPISVSHLVLSDNVGNVEELSAVDEGVYQTSRSGIQGVTGRVYKVRVEFRDGRIYESIPDTLLVPASMNSIRFEFNNDGNSLYGSPYGFDVFANSSAGSATTNRFMWATKGTFQGDTHPELIDTKHSKCYDQGNSVCSFFPPCSGLRNIGTTYAPTYIWEGPCTCCTCWYDIFSKGVALSDDHLSKGNQFSTLKVFRVPVSAWIFMHKIHLEVSIRSLTYNSFQFFKAIRDQEAAIGSLFQPITGHIPNNFIQVSGDPAPLVGLFFAAGISSQSTFITRADVPDESVIPFLEPPPGGTRPDAISCLELFPYATNVKPDFWVD